MKNIVALIFTSLLLFSCANDKNKTVVKDKKEKNVTEIDTENSKEFSLIETSDKAINLLKNKKFVALSSLIHPTLGIRFSPTAYIDVNTDLSFNTVHFKSLIAQQDKLSWGTHKGSGESINLAFNNYYAAYIYDADYLNAERITANNCLKDGSVMNNISEIYGDAEYVEYYFSGFEKQHDGLDWKALRLVFKKLDNKYYIIGVVHN